MNIWEIHELLGLKKFEAKFTKDGFQYRGVLATGKFNGVDDYDAGLLEMQVQNPIDLKYPMVIITTIDDGVWQGFGKKHIDIELFVKEFNKSFRCSLPTEEKLNDFLNQYEIHGLYTG